MNFTPPERRAILIVLVLAEVALTALAFLPTFLSQLPLLDWESAGWPVGWLIEVREWLIDVVQWCAWMLEIDPRLYAILAALGQLFLVSAVVRYAPGNWLARGLALVAGTGMAYVVAMQSVHVQLGDRYRYPLLFCAAYVAPLLLEGAIPPRPKLSLPVKPALTRGAWRFGVRELLGATFLIALLMALAGAANTIDSPRWLDVISNGFIWGVCPWIALRLILGRRALWLTFAPIGLAIVAVAGLLLRNSWDFAPAVSFFSTRWVTVVAENHWLLFRGVAGFVALSLAWTVAPLAVLRACGFCLARPDAKESEDSAPDATEVLESASS